METQFPRARSVLIQADWLLVAVLSTTAGAVDVIGFLALGGLFTAHITGNLVVLAAHYATGRYSEIGPLLSVPVFIGVLWITVLFANKVSGNTRRALLVVHAVLLAGFLVFGVRCGPFTDPDSAIAVCAGMFGVAAMATQNALVKLELRGFPSTAVVTTNTVQLTIDLALLIRGKGDPRDLAQAHRRARLTIPSVGGFVAGCATGGFLEIHFGLRSLVLPVLLAVVAVLLGETWLVSPEGARS
jgi:uncharacterized membrane protein YoaK (UPF0700 family)